VPFIPNYPRCAVIPNKSISQACITFQNIKVKTNSIKFTTNFYDDTIFNIYLLFIFIIYFLFSIFVKQDENNIFQEVLYPLFVSEIATFYILKYNT
jgi:hypothetical protein